MTPFTSCTAPEPLTDVPAWLHMGILQILSALIVGVLGPARRALAHQGFLASITSLGAARLSLNPPGWLCAEVGHKGIAQVSEGCEVCPQWQASVHVS